MRRKRGHFSPPSATVPNLDQVPTFGQRLDEPLPQIGSGESSRGRHRRGLFLCLDFWWFGWVVRLAGTTVAQTVTIPSKAPRFARWRPPFQRPPSRWLDVQPE